MTEYILIDHGNYNKVYHAFGEENLKEWLSKLSKDVSVFNTKDSIKF